MVQRPLARKIELDQSFEGILFEASFGDSTREILHHLTINQDVLWVADSQQAVDGILQEFNCHLFGADRTFLNVASNDIAPFAFGD